MNQLELFPTESEHPTNPLKEGFKCIYCGFNAYIAVFADHTQYIVSNQDWLDGVQVNIAQQTTRTIVYVLYVHDKKTGQTYKQGL